MSRMNDPIENAVEGFRAGLKDGDNGSPGLLQSFKPLILLFVIVAVTAGIVVFLA